MKRRRVDAEDPSAGSDFALDEQERQKIDALAKPFISKSVSNLPATLEGTINSYHNENACRLIQNSDCLAGAVSELTGIISELSRTLETAAGARQHEIEVYEQLRAIDSNKEKDATVISRQKQVVALLQQIVERAKIPDSVRHMLQTPAFGDMSSLDDLYATVDAVTREVRLNEIPKEYQGLAIWPKRISELDQYLHVFAGHFKRLMQGRLSDIQNCKTLAHRFVKTTIQYIPQLDPAAPPRAFSETVDDHDILRSIWLYSKFILWIRDFDPLRYREIANGAYLKCAQEYLDSVCDLQHTTVLIKQYHRNRAPSTSDPYYIDDELTSAAAREISTGLTKDLGKLFRAIRVELCILTEFWGIEETSTLQQIISKTLIKSAKLLFQAAAAYDPFFGMKSYGICAAAAKEIRISIARIIDAPRKFWDGWIAGQRDLLSKVKTSKTRTRVILSPFTQFPLFFAQYSKIAETVERPVLEVSLSRMSDDLVDWLVKSVSIRYVAKKRIHLIVYNLSYLCDKLKEEPLKSFVEDSAVLTESLKKKEVLLQAHIRDLLRAVVKKSWADSCKFFDQIIAWRERTGFTTEMVTFQPTHAELQFSAMNDRLTKKLGACINDCFTYIRKKIHNDGLSKELRGSLGPFLKEMFTKWDQLAVEIYGTKLSVSADALARVIPDRS
jgi:hypothetical protein